jgi:hypothetical protein
MAFGGGWMNVVNVMPMSIIDSRLISSMPVEDMGE